MLSFLASLAALLAPPQLLGRGAGLTRLRVPVTDTLALEIFEADEQQQSLLVEAALESEAPVGGKEDDPYGVVLWPAAQVVANAMTKLDGLRGASVLELGAGTGLCSLAALACGARHALATDYRAEPLGLLRDAAEANGLGQEGADSGMLSTALFDIKGEDDALPMDADFVVAADLLYLKSTSVALARRCVEALRSDACREVLVGDLGRPGRQAFLSELVEQGVRPEAAKFVAVDGWSPGVPRHELVCSQSQRAPSEGELEADTRAQQVSVGLLRLVRQDLVQSQ